MALKYVLFSTFSIHQSKQSFHSVASEFEAIKINYKSSPSNLTGCVQRASYKKLIHVVFSQGGISRSMKLENF
jgi:hypothetical protein